MAVVHLNAIGRLRSSATRSSASILHDVSVTWGSEEDEDFFSGGEWTSYNSEDINGYGSVGYGNGNGNSPRYVSYTPSTFGYHY